MKDKHCIAITGGGSGGHVYPALAVLEQLQKLGPNVKILWIGSKNGIEKEIVQHYYSEIPGLEFRSISCGKLRRYFSWRNATDLFRVILGIVQSFLLLRRERPQLLFSKGGFVSVPPIIAAKLLGIRSWAHESDLDPGLATKIAVPLVEKLYLPYEYSRRFFSKKYWGKLEVSGNPVRAEFFATESLRSEVLPAEWYREDGKLQRPLILVLGGSLGAKELNNYVRDLLELEQDGHYYIFHQCGNGGGGAGGRDGGRDDYEKLRQLKLPHYKVQSFITDGLAQLYSLCRESDGLVLSRAGAGTLWEILASRNRAILLPLQSGSRGDQLRNAEFFARQDWAQHFMAQADQQRNVANLLAQIRVILQDRRNRAVDIPSIPNAAKIIAHSIWAKICIEE